MATPVAWSPEEIAFAQRWGGGTDRPGVYRVNLSAPYKKAVATVQFAPDGTWGLSVSSVQGFGEGRAAWSWAAKRLGLAGA